MAFYYSNSYAHAVDIQSHPHFTIYYNKTQFTKEYRFLFSLNCPQMNHNVHEVANYAMKPAKIYFVILLLNSESSFIRQYYLEYIA